MIKNKEINNKLRNIAILAEVENKKNDYSMSNYFYDALFDFISTNFKYDRENWQSEAILNFYIDFVTEEFDDVEGDPAGDVVEKYRDDFVSADKEIDKEIIRHRRKINHYEEAYGIDEVMSGLWDFISDISYIFNNLNAKVEPFLDKNYGVE